MRLLRRSQLLASSGLTIGLRSQGGSLTSSTTFTLSFSGMAADDLVTVFIDGDGGGTPAATGWTWVPGTTSGTKLGVIWKVLTAADITAGSVGITGVNGSGVPIFWAAWKGGATGLALKSAVVSGASDSFINLSGFAKAGNSAIVVAAAFDNDNGALPSPPAGWTTDRSASTGGTYPTLIAHLASANYADNAGVSLTGFTATLIQAGLLLELTG